MATFGSRWTPHWFRNWPLWFPADLLAAQRDHRIHSRGTTGRYVARQEGESRKQRRRSGEYLSYGYDSLMRLSAAGSAQWGLTFGYDGFGNRTAQTWAGGGNSQTLSFDANNHINTSGYVYDLNGNMTTIPIVGTATYDVENHLVVCVKQNADYQECAGHA